jgi:rod shape determining protein RodA
VAGGSATVSRYIHFRDFDWVLLVFVLVICMLGVSEIYSATLHTKFEGMQIRQVYWIIAGVCLMFMVSLINYQALLELVPWMYGFSLLSLVAVLLFGKRYLGAKRWIDFRVFHF